MISGYHNKQRQILLVGVILLWGLCAGVNAEETSWKVYRPGAAEGKLSYEPRSVVEQDGVVDVWSKFEPVADAQIREMRHSVRFDCGRKRMKVLRTITVYRNGRTADLSPQNKFEAVETASTSAILLALVCKEKNEPPAAPQDPASAPVEQPAKDLQPTVAPAPTAPQEPVPVPTAPQESVVAPVEPPRTDVQAPLEPQHQQPGTPSVEAPATAPANLPQ